MKNHHLYEHLIVQLQFLQQQRIILLMKIIFQKLINKYEHQKILYNHLIFQQNIQSI